ncbi:MAG: VWA domain-containing protein [Gammaproteobacteria bacterium]
MKLPRRTVEIFSLSFLDCICCGFGAIILLLVLTEYGQPVQIEEGRIRLTGQVQQLGEQLHEIRGDTELLNRELKGRLEQLQKEKMRLAQLAGDLTDVNGQFSASKKEASVTNTVETELVSAYQTMTEEMKRLLKDQASRPKSEAIGGIPIDSEYVIFIIDTSASMTQGHWPEARAIMQEILSIYPKVKGLQILDDEGKVMLGGTRGQWLNDTQAQRKQIVDKFNNWRAFSNSSPVEGIEEAIKVYWAPDKRISLYVLGDEFTGDSIQKALDDVTALNKVDRDGRRLVRIHAVGFPERPGMTPFTSIRFSALMRLMCEQNNGTFVGITG